MRLMAGQWLSGRVEHRLDWFHLRRRFQWLARSIYWALDYDDPAYDERRARYRRNLRSARECLAPRKIMARTVDDTDGPLVFSASRAAQRS